MPADVSGLSALPYRLPNPWPLARTGHRWLQRARRRSTTVDGHRVVWLERGRRRPDRPSIVLLHGLAAMKENWSAWLPMFPGDSHVLALDIPGFGESEYKVGAAYGYREQARRLRQWLGAAGLGQVHLVGSSMGAAIATVMAEQAGERVASLTVMNSAGIPHRADVDLTRPPTFDSTLLLPEDWSGLYRMFNGVSHGAPSVAGVAMLGLLGVDLLRRSGQNRHVFADMVDDPFAPVTGLGPQTPPLLVIWGDRDRITLPGCVDWYRDRVPHAEVHVLPGVGHLPMLERPRRSYRILADFLARQAD
ncbi:alpha/beta fold hydrolase [Marinobacter bohaiensis]|uniref:alpha/beta fold hydrolase n=1 Tax=Marinobacter bohaiensis TaxID=2201898 RepID=UPI000DACD953|nr:alpha/beta fold hydrolase [Marinobacter bohaiensis]